MADTVQGLDRMLADLQKHADALLDRGRSATREEAEGVLAGARVPMATGELRDSGKVIETPTGFEVVFDAPHAFIVHEDPEAEHDDGEWKYLENAVSRSTRGRSGRLAARMKGAQ